jgi:hypothetical protein
VKISASEACACGSGKAYGECHGAQRDAPSSSSLQHVALRVIPEPDPGTRAVFERPGPGTVFFEGIQGGYALDCGKCGAPLALRVDRDSIQGLALRCAQCGSFNDT